MTSFQERLFAMQDKQYAAFSKKKGTKHSRHRFRFKFNLSSNINMNFITA